MSHDAPLRPPGLRRVGGCWLDQRGETVGGDTLARLKRLAIPPAWTHVWADPDPGAALQAVGQDAKGRTQYRYHPDAVAARARDKFEHVARFAEVLPQLRSAAQTGLAGTGLGRERVLGACVRLLERGFFRVGNQQYAREDHTYGLTTLQRTQVRVRGQALAFDYIAKEHLHRVDASAKSFRTWAGTVLAAAALGGADLTGLARTNARSPENAAVQATSKLLGNTPSVARASYIHPAVLSAAKDGRTVHDDLAAAAERVGSDRLAAVWTDARLQSAVRRLLP